MRAALIGCGGIAELHAEALRLADRVTLDAVCEIDPQKARDFADRWGVKHVFQDFDALIRDARPEIVTLALPTQWHADFTLRAARAGIPWVLCEKPMARNLAEADAMRSTCKAHGTHLLVHHQRRTFPAFREIRRRIESGAIGEVECIRASTAGDLLTDGTHLLNTVLFLNGDTPVRSVTGQIVRERPREGQKLGKAVSLQNGYRYRHGSPIEDAALAILHLANGVRVECFTGNARPNGRIYHDLEIIGSTGRLWKKVDRDLPTFLQQSGSGPWETVSVEEPPTTMAGAVALNYDRMARAEPHPLDAANGFTTLEAIMAIFEAARTHRSVTLPLAQKNSGLELIAREQEDATP